MLLGGTMEKRYEQTLSAGMDGNCEYTCHALIWHQSMYFGIACYTVKAGLKTDRDISCMWLANNLIYGVYAAK